MSISGRRFGLLVLAWVLAAGASSSAFASSPGSTNPTMRVQFIHMNQHLSDMYGLGTYIGLRYPDLSGPSLERLRMTGVDWVREEFTASDLHHSVSAPLQFQNDDRVINQERRDGLHILGLLDYNNTFNGESHTNMPHRDIQRLTRDFVAYVSATVRHYRNQIYYWQVWNEPDLHEFWGPETYAQDYAYLLRQAYGAIKQANPQAKVLIGGPSGRDPHGMHFLKRVIQFGGKFDIMSAQPYTTEPGPDFGLTLQKLRAFHKPVWVTEMGWAGEAYCGPCGSPWDQAARLTTAYFIAAIDGIDRMFWYDFRDDGLGPNFPDHFGLVEWNLAAKPAYFSFETSLF
ncbi:MAG TPA: glycosyl hydrolase 53 family protein, partial [Chloroflexota bacterium]|nr:glycosyl hydrolase 53 family protein [Chloroflexota bacterium]